MTAFRHLSAIDQAELALEQAIAQRRWNDTLPSNRQLAGLLGLSGPTVALAVKRLVGRGILVSPGDRRRFRMVRKGGGRRAPAGRARRLLIVHPQTGDGTDVENQRIAKEAKIAAVKDGWTCVIEGLDYISAKQPLRRWDRLLEHEPSHLLAVPGTRLLGEWARRKGIPAAFIGGQQVAPEMATCIGVRAPAVLGHCLGQLRKLGHRRILVPYWGDMPAVAESVARVMAAEGDLGAERLLAEGWVSRWQPGDRDARLAQFRRVLERLRPTAIVTLVWPDHLIASQGIAQAGLRTPHDISLVTLRPGADIQWISPRPAHYRLGEPALIKAFRLWLRGKPSAADSTTRTTLASWTEGETLGPARAAQ